MPMYKYVCIACGKEHEHIVSYSDREELIECPECSSDSHRCTKPTKTAFKLLGGKWADSGYGGNKLPGL